MMGTMGQYKVWKEPRKQWAKTEFLKDGFFQFSDSFADAAFITKNKKQICNIWGTNIKGGGLKIINIASSYVSASTNVTAYSTFAL